MPLPGYAELVLKSLKSRMMQNFKAAAIFLERLFDAFDIDGNRRIDFEEFAAGLSKLEKGTEEEKLERRHVVDTCSANVVYFKIFDLNRDGNVTPKELVAVMSEIVLWCAARNSQPRG